MKNRTHGPWKISSQTCRYKIDDPRKLKVCSEQGFTVAFDALGISNARESLTLAIVPLDDSNEANARLIAAAPELLMCCEASLTYLMLEGHLDRHQLMEELRKVLRKVDGENDASITDSTPA